MMTMITMMVMMMIMTVNPAVDCELHKGRNWIYLLHHLTQQTSESLWLEASTQVKKKKLND